METRGEWGRGVILPLLCPRVDGLQHGLSLERDCCKGNVLVKIYFHRNRAFFCTNYGIFSR